VSSLRVVYEELPCVARHNTISGEERKEPGAFIGLFARNRVVLTFGSLIPRGCRERVELFS